MLMSEIAFCRVKSGIPQTKQLSVVGLLAKSEHLEQFHHLSVHAGFIPLWRVLVTYYGCSIRFMVSVMGQQCLFVEREGPLPTEASQCPLQAVRA